MNSYLRLRLAISFCCCVLGLASEGFAENLTARVTNLCPDAKINAIWLTVQSGDSINGATPPSGWSLCTSVPHVYVGFCANSATHYIGFEGFKDFGLVTKNSSGYVKALCLWDDTGRKPFETNWVSYSEMNAMIEFDIPCGEPIPTLANYGLLVLLVLLILSGIIVIRRRRRGVVAR